MKKFSVPSINVSYNSSLFGNNRPFEASPTRSSLQMRAHRSPDLGNSAISINNHIRNREFYWFTNIWNVTVNNNTSITINGINVNITANHVNGGKSRSRNTFFNSITSGGSSQTSFFPPNEGFSNMIMDSSTNPNLNFTVSYFNGGTTTDITFNWGGQFTQLSGGQPVLTTTTRALSTWGTNRGVNVTVDLFDGGGSGPGFF